MRDLIVSEFGEEAYSFLERHTSLNDIETEVLHSTNTFNILRINGSVQRLVNLSKVNDFRFINKYFEAVNSKLEVGGQFIGCFESFTARRERLKIGRIPFLRHFYFVTEFIFKRVFPKLWGLKKIYFFITRGRDRVLSKAEVLGRLVCCGFEISDFRNINGLIYFVARKEKDPSYDMNPSYGPFFAMPRIGKNGKMIRVYKLRTMHPYAEYLQDYLIKQHGYNELGKPAHDFRLTPWGRILRKYWLDELPQLLNVVKGEMSLMGVRPLSKTRFNEFPDDIRRIRGLYKPGCIPPYVSLNMPDKVGNIEAERIYLKRKRISPFATDLEFTFRALYNIFSNKIHSS